MSGFSSVSEYNLDLQLIELSRRFSSIFPELLLLLSFFKGFPEGLRLCRSLFSVLVSMFSCFPMRSCMSPFWQLSVLFKTTDQVKIYCLLPTGY